MREKILEISLEQFSNYGIRAVTMEDIARQAGISKKTIYLEFKDKRELVREAFTKLIKGDKTKLKEILDSDDGVIDHLVRTSVMIRYRLSKLNPMVIMEVQRYFPDTWEVFESFRDNVILPDLINVLERGKELGYFRPEIDAKILAYLRIEQINSAFNPANFGKHDFNLLELQVQILDHFLHGIFTEKGRSAYLEKRDSTNESKV